jgi:hypothetical protein
MDLRNSSSNNFYFYEMEEEISKTLDLTANLFTDTLLRSLGDLWVPNRSELGFDYLTSG